MTEREPLYWRHLAPDTRQIVNSGMGDISAATAELMRQDMFAACARAGLHDGPSAMRLAGDGAQRTIGDYSIHFLEYTLSAGDPQLGTFFIWREVSPGFNEVFATADLLREGGLAFYGQDDQAAPVLDEIMGRAIVLDYIRR